jgi:pseudouridine kinase
MEAMEELLPSSLEERSAALDAASCLVVDANIPESSLAWIGERYKDRPRGERPLLVLDPVSVAKAHKAKAHIGSFDLGKPNIAEARVLAGRPDEDDPTVLAAALIEGGLGAVHMSLGPDGMYYEGFRDEGERGMLRPPSSLPERLGARNVSGAGDAACAALVWAAFKGLGARERSQAALAAACLAASVEETVHPRLSQEFLASTMDELFPPRSSP